MGPKEEPGMLALLIALAAVLYVVTRLVAGPMAFPEVPAVVPPDHTLPVGATSQLAGTVPAPR